MITKCTRLHTDDKALVFVKIVLALGMSKKILLNKQLAI
jgi:hypothetical protein